MATTLYINKYETVALSEVRSTGIGWTSVADSVTVTDVVPDLLVGYTRAVTAAPDSISISESCTTSIVIHGYLDEVMLPRTLEALGNQIAETDVLTRIPVRQLTTQGGAALNEYLPIRTCSATVEFTYAVTLAGLIPGRILTGITGAEQVSGLIPVRTATGECYPVSVILTGTVPVRTLSAETSKFDVAELDGKIPVRIGSISGLTTYVIVLTGIIPARYGSGSISQDYGVSLGGLIPPRKIDSDEYEVGVNGSGYIPVRLGGFSGDVSGVGTVVPTITDDYILQYVRP